MQCENSQCPPSVVLFRLSFKEFLTRQLSFSLDTWAFLEGSTWEPGSPSPLLRAADSFVPLSVKHNFVTSLQIDPVGTTLIDDSFSLFKGAPLAEK